MTCLRMRVFLILPLIAASAAAAEPCRVVVWDERQPPQKQAYETFLGNRIAEHLRSLEGIDVRSVALDDGEQGLAAAILDFAEALFWWGHVRHAEVKPERGREIVAADHPLAAGLPLQFTLPRTEMYDEPFHVPEPDLVIAEETWEAGERFRSVMLWKLGKGRVIYIRPGHETFPIFADAHMLRLLENVVRTCRDPVKP